jgi:hypothetical protein
MISVTLKVMRKKRTRKRTRTRRGTRKMRMMNWVTVIYLEILTTKMKTMGAWRIV